MTQRTLHGLHSLRFSAPVMRVVLSSLLAIGLAASGAGCSSDDSDSGNAGNEGGSESSTNEGGGSGFGVVEFGTIDVSPLVIQFISTLETSRAVAVVNTSGSSTVTVTNIYLKDDTTAHFTMEPFAERALGPGQAFEVKVYYEPGDGTPGGTVVVEHDAPNQDAFQVSLFVSAEGGAAQVAPTFLDFGEIPLGGSVTKQVFVDSFGSAPVTVTDILVSAVDEAGFSAPHSSDVPIVIAAGDNQELDVTFSPTEVGDFEGTVVVRVNGADQADFEVDLTGTGITSDLAFQPGFIDFGTVDLGGTSERSLTLTNIGDAALTVESGAITFGTSPYVAVEDSPSWPTTLEPGDSTEVAFSFTPTESFPYTIDPIGGYNVVTDEVDSVGLVVPMFGNVAAADLLVTPNALDFGLVAQNDTVFRDVFLSNQGQANVVLQDWMFPNDSGGEFAIATWAPPGISPGHVMIPGETLTLTLSFTNLGGETGAVSGQWSVTSTDPDTPTETVDLTATRAGAKECQIVVEPGSLNFGIVPFGNTKTMPMKIRNTGTGPCTFKSATTFNCGSGLLGFLGDCSAGIGNQAKYFKVVSQPPPIPGGIPQGGEVTVQVLFKPPSDAPLLDLLNAYAAAIQVEVTDPSNGDASLVVPPGATADELDPNLFAQSGITDIGVIPSEVDFGLVTIGCTSKTTTITIYNNGNAPLSLSGLELIDCTSEFVLKNEPTIPPEGLVVTQSTPVTVDVLYVPETPGISTCTLAVESTDSDQPLLTVPLQGEGTFLVDRTDEFVQSSGQEVDILFVVDNSGSMSEEQENLANNFQALIAQANTWGSAYHLGVVTTDMDDDNMKGRLQGSPRFVVPGPSAESQFKNNVQVGAGGAGFQESGLEAAYRALTNPLIRETTITCSSDADCTEPDVCLEGTCGGQNKGFLRDDASLEIVFVSDEEDQSPSPLNFYADFFKSLKGFANENLIHAHSIVGDAPNGCDTSDGLADSGDRYIEVSNATGGKVGSICDNSFASVLSDIGDVAFGLKVQFFLSAQAEPGTVEVIVQGSPCSGGWDYDFASNSVIFDEFGSCMPDEGDLIVINYKMLCLNEL